MSTKGEMRVGISFNPSKSPVVDKLKEVAAELIDLIEEIEVPAGVEAEVGRLKALAQTEVEDGTMWAVKAATKRKEN